VATIEEWRQQTMATAKQSNSSIVHSETFHADKPAVAIEARVRRYATMKAVLSGATYEAFAQKEDNLSDELDWDEHHLGFNSSTEEWTIDAADKSLAVLEEKLTENGYSFGGVTADVIDMLNVTVAPPRARDDAAEWADMGIILSVTYNTKRNGTTKTQEGRLVSLTPENQQVCIKTTDNEIVRLNGNELHRPSSRYSYLGEVQTVDVAVKEISHD